MVEGEDHGVQEGGGRGKDVWRDTPLRLMGYANEVGESLRFVYPPLVVPSYALSIGYVLGDTIDKARREPQTGRFSKAMDVLIWQMLASVAVPGATINLTVKAARAALGVRKSSLPNSLTPVQRWGPTAIGLGVIPFIVQPIDQAVDHLMDDFIRMHL
jgi:fission process protein 1